MREKYIMEDFSSLLKKRKVKRDSVKDDMRVIKTSKSVMTFRLRTPKERFNTRALGFEFTLKEERMYEAAIKEAKEFMENEYSGHPPRMRGEYFIPGHNPKDIEAGRIWVSQETAVLYAHMHKRTFVNFVADYDVEKRAYQKNGSKTYYEYELESLKEALKRYEEDHRNAQTHP